ncbi:TPA: hypothetical protein EYP26_02710 [Candidatus Bathyarchaeota archaeon]|nr:hypothetical protein [Candidatus Bathyarchaeota archaeon]
MRLNALLNRLDRIVAWTLLALFFLMMVSGYMITRGFVSVHYGSILHTQLDLPIMALFSAHFSVRLKFALMRLRVKDSLALNIFCLTVGLASFLFVVYLDLWY